MIEQKAKNLIKLISVRKKDKALSKTAYLEGRLISKIYNLDNIGFDDSVLVIDAVEILPYLYRKGITNVTYIQYGTIEDEKIPTTDMLGYTYINIPDRKSLTKSLGDQKFDCILANPPYDRKAHLHQKFFNKAFKHLKDGCTMTFIQPSRPYLTAFDDSNKFVDDTNMRNIVINNYSKVKFITNSAIDHSDMKVLFHPLAATVITKGKSGFKGVDEFTDMEGNVYTNVDINDLNMNSTSPELYRSMIDKVKAMIDRYGCLGSIIYFHRKDVLEDGKKVLHLPTTRGTEGKNDLYTWVDVNGENGLPKLKYPNKPTYGAMIDTDVDPKVAYTFFRTYFARFCMSIGKQCRAVGCGVATTPKLELNKVWTDEELFELAGFTNEEIAEVYRYIPSFY